MLETIYNKMKVEPFYAMVNPGEAAELAACGLVELNHDIVDDFGSVAARLTASGILEYENSSKIATKTKEKRMNFEVTKGGFEPAPRKTFTRESKFPFDALEVGDSFFVADRDAKSFASTVTAANRKYSEETNETETYKFRGEEHTRAVRKSLRKFAAKDVYGGVQVGRVA